MGTSQKHSSLYVMWVPSNYARNSCKEECNFFPCPNFLITYSWFNRTPATQATVLLYLHGLPRSPVKLQ